MVVVVVVVVLVAVAAFAVCTGVIVGCVQEWLDRRRNKIVIDIKQQDLDLAEWGTEIRDGW